MRVHEFAFRSLHGGQPASDGEVSELVLTTLGRAADSDLDLLSELNMPIKALSDSL